MCKKIVLDYLNTFLLNYVLFYLSIYTSHVHYKLDTTFDTLLGNHMIKFFEYYRYHIYQIDKYPFIFHIYNFLLIDIIFVLL